jgi:hypothetical protein
LGIGHDLLAESVDRLFLLGQPDLEDIGLLEILFPLKLDGSPFPLKTPVEQGQDNDVDSQGYDDQNKETVLDLCGVGEETDQRQKETNNKKEVIPK